MKRLFFVAVFVLSAFIGFSQISKDEMLKENGEVYFQFQVSDQKDISGITKIISIDNVSGNTVYAYANEKELNDFEALGIPYTLLPLPNEEFNPVMKDFDELKNSDAWDAYPTYTAYVSMMYAFETNFPGLCDVFSIGQTVQGRELLVAKILDNVTADEAEPEFFYTSTMHGDETTGYVLMLRLIDSLLTAYTTSPRIASLVNNIEIYINPLANPDGTYKTGNNSVAGAVRYNANFVDLNRNFPDVIDGLYPNTQPETYAFMDFAESRNLVLSCNIHGGTEVCNYPWDHKYAFAADDSWWQYVCHEFADTCQMYAPSNYMNGYDDGITNGADWYVIDGGRQDYMNFYHQCREFTLEISDTKLLPAASLPAYWGYNRRSFLNYLEQCTFGIRGMVTDAVSGLPVQAEIFILSHDIIGDSSWIYSSPLGNYHRLLNAGNYNVRVSAPCYETQIFNNISVVNKNATYLNVQLIPIYSVDFTASLTSPLIGQTVNFTGICNNIPNFWLWTFTPSSVTYEGGTHSGSQSPQVYFNAPGVYSVQLSVGDTECNNSIIKTDYINVQSLDFFVDLRVMLEGSFIGSDMNTTLSVLSDFPLSQPYSASPWIYPGTEVVVTVPENVVDWVLVELRDAPDAASATSATRIARYAGFLLNDGSIVSTDGISNQQFNNLTIQQSLFVVIWHRNHLPVLSSSPPVKTGDVYAYDFTSDVGQAFGTDAQKFLSTGIFGMIGGDSNADGSIDDLDKVVLWQTEAGESGYLPSDLNLDGQSSNIDKNDFWLPNTGSGAQLP
jgi:PKD repeat protein